ncbi:MAG: hypothetical protein ABIP27_14705 [Flavobacterium circumlabens]|uniref:OB-fold protein n=1 Tax=Flavobacterium circumlabens TaxID=2133765 RepID=UPI003262D29B
MKRKRTAFVLAALLIVAAAGIYFYYGFLFKGARDIASEKADFNITATKLLEAYNEDPKKADALYLNKTIEITGAVTKETDSVITLENTVFCLFTQKIKEKHLDHKVSVKGKCIGYDELFQEVKLDQCTLNQTHN